MGSEFTLLEAGGAEPRTKIVDDQDEMAGRFGGKYPNQISQIRVWPHCDNINAIEVWYEGIST